MIQRLRSVCELLLIFVSGIIIYTGVVKLIDNESFYAALSVQGLIPKSLVGVTTWIVPITELILGVGVLWLLLNRHRRAPASVMLIAMLLGGFSVYAWIVAGTAEAGKSSCGCGLPAFMGDTWSTIAARNALLSLTTVACGLCVRSTVKGRELPT